MRNYVVTKELEQEMKLLKSEGISPHRISKQLGISVMTIYRHLNGKRESDKTRMPGAYRGKLKQVAPPGFFNEHERENWLV